MAESFSDYDGPHNNSQDLHEITGMNNDRQDKRKGEASTTAKNNTAADRASNIRAIKRLLNIKKRKSNDRIVAGNQHSTYVDNDTVSCYNGECAYVYEKNEVPVVFLMGQSNIDGRGKLEDVPEVNATFNGEVKIWNKPLKRHPKNVRINHINNGVWKDYEVGDMVTSPEGPQSFGPELQIAIMWRNLYYEQLVNKPLYIIKCAIGSTSLGGRRFSKVDESWHDAENTLRTLAVDYFARPAIRQLQNQGLKPKSIGFIWGQGERDTKNNDQAAKYFVRLSKFIPDITAKIGFPDSRVLIMGLSNAHDNSSNWMAVKRAQIDYVLSDDRAVLIPTDGGHASADNHSVTIHHALPRYIMGANVTSLHYTSSGVITLGSLFFCALEFPGVSLVDYSVS